MALSQFNVVQNRNTSQPGMLADGLTGPQLIKFIQADRLYVKAPLTTNGTTVPTFTRSNGATPTGWTDLGALDSVVKVTYDQKVAKVTTGVDEYLRGAYTQSKGGMIDFTLTQVDDAAFALVSGIDGSVVVPGSLVTFDVGSTDMTQLAVLVVSQDKLSGKEFQYFNPNMFLTWGYDTSKDALVLKCQGFAPYWLPAGATQETIFRKAMFSHV